MNANNPKKIPGASSSKEKGSKTESTNIGEKIPEIVESDDKEIKTDKDLNDFKLFDELKTNLESLSPPPDIFTEPIIPNLDNESLFSEDNEQPTGHCAVCGEFSWIYIHKIHKLPVSNIKNSSKSDQNDSVNNDEITFLCQKHYSDKMKEYLKNPELDPGELLTEELHLRDIPLNYAREFFGDVSDFEYLLSKLDKYLNSKMKRLNEEIESMGNEESAGGIDPYFKKLQFKEFEELRFMHSLTLALKEIYKL